MEHFSYAEIVRRMAKSGWGKGYPDIHQAMQDLRNSTGHDVGITQAGILALVQRMESASKIVDAVMNGIEAAILERRPKGYLVDFDDLEIDENAKQFPGAKVGDLLWGGNFWSRFKSSVVVYATENGHCLIPVFDGGRVDGDHMSVNVMWATESHYATLREAVGAACVEDDCEEATRKQLAAIQKAKALFESGGDLTEIASRHFDE